MKMVNPKRTKLVYFECLLRLVVLQCLFLYGPLAHGPLKLDLSTLFATLFLWTSIILVYSENVIYMTDDQVSMFVIKCPKQCPWRERKPICVCHIEVDRFEQLFASANNTMTFLEHCFVSYIRFMWCTSKPEQ